VQARYKIKHSDLLMKASFQHKSEHLILHTYLENRILNKELNIQIEYQDIRGHTSDCMEQTKQT